MSTVHLVGGEKGGVGKSVVARLLAQSFIDRSIERGVISDEEAAEFRTMFDRIRDGLATPGGDEAVD